MTVPRHLKRVDWDSLRSWCLAHGAKNDSVESIRIDRGQDEEFVVILEGFELSNDGTRFIESGNDVARWRSANPLRFLP